MSRPTAPFSGRRLRAAAERVIVSQASRMAGRRQDRKGWLLAVVLAGTTGFATSLGGLIAPSAVLLLGGPVLGVGAIVSFVLFLRTGPAGRPMAAAGLGVACAVFSIVIPAFLLYAFRFAGD